MQMLRIVLTTLLLLGAYPVSAQQAALCSATQPIAQVLALMAERLKLASDVARYKWNTQGKTEDLAREQAIITGLGQQALKQGLPVIWTEHFFRAQIQASKKVQQGLFAHWQQVQAGHFGNTPDLAAVTRPKLDGLTAELIKALAAAWPHLHNPACRHDIKQLIPQNLPIADYDADAIAMAAAPLILK